MSPVYDRRFFVSGCEDLQVVSFGMSREYSCATKRIALTAQTRFFGEATATIEYEGEREAWQTCRVSRLTFEYKKVFGTTIKVEIPSQALKDAGPVYANRWEFRDEESVRLGKKFLYLVAHAPHEVSSDQWKDKTLHFVICDGVFERLGISTPLLEERSLGYERFECP